MLCVRCVGFLIGVCRVVFHFIAGCRLFSLSVSSWFFVACVLSSLCCRYMYLFSGSCFDIGIALVFFVLSMYVDASVPLVRCVWFVCVCVLYWSLVR